MAGNVYLTLHPDVYAMRHRHWHQKVFIQFFVELQTELDTGTNQTETKLQAPPLRKGWNWSQGSEKSGQETKRRESYEQEGLARHSQLFSYSRKKTLSRGHGKVIRGCVRIWFPR